MAKNPYNGFTPQQRTAGGRWYRARVADGTVITHDECCTCGSTTHVNGHSEDYSPPFGPHIGAFDLCFVCHMMLHCRHRNSRRFDDYCFALEAGNYWPTKDRNFQTFAARFLNARALPMKNALTRTGPVRVSLREMGEGRYNPNAGGLDKWAPDYKKEVPSGGQADLI